MNREKLAERFSSLWERFAATGDNAESVWHCLQNHYDEPHRFYHNLDHLDHCLGQLDLARDEIEECDAIEMAIWFHDIIYQYGAKDNEALSAVTFRELAGNAMPEDFVERVCELILATVHTGSARDAGEAFMVDIDLSGFGLPWEGYLADSMNLRKEAPEVADDRYYEGKLRFLDSLLAWPKIFQTGFFCQRLENQARENIARFSGDLREQGFGQTTC